MPAESALSRNRSTASIRTRGVAIYRQRDFDQGQCRPRRSTPTGYRAEDRIAAPSRCDQPVQCRFISRSASRIDDDFYGSTSAGRRSPGCSIDRPAAHRSRQRLDPCLSRFQSTVGQRQPQAVNPRQAAR